MSGSRTSDDFQRVNEPPAETVNRFFPVEKAGRLRDVGNGIFGGADGRDSFERFILLLSRIRESEGGRSFDER